MEYIWLKYALTCAIFFVYSLLLLKSGLLETSKWRANLAEKIVVFVLCASGVVTPFYLLMFIWS